MKTNVFVFPCGSEIGLEISRSLEFSNHLNLIGGSSVDDHGKFVYKKYISDVSFVTELGFINEINNIVDKYRIDFIFPAHDSVVLKLAQEQAAGNLHCEVVTSPVATCEIANSKLKTYGCFNGVIPTPKVYGSLADLQPSDFPIFLKPDVGQGSKGTHIAKDANDVEFYTDKDPSLLLLEYLPEREYTVDCFTNKDGKLLFCEGRERIRIANGISVNSAQVDDEQFEVIANKINGQLEFRGAWFFQLKENRVNELVLMEIATRIAGTMGLVRCRGANLALLSVFDRMNYDVDVFENDITMVIDRALQNRYKHNIYYKHVYVDFDDLVVFENKINPVVMAFVYQCINKGIQLHLITRHKHDIGETLKKYRLEATFDEVIPITKEDEKTPYIKHTDAIFIDDSFAERKKVHELCGIAVFDSHMIEGLMELF